MFTKSYRSALASILWSPAENKDATIASLRRTLWLYRAILIALIVVSILSYKSVQEANNAMMQANTPEREWKRLEAEAQTYVDRPDPRMPGYGYAMRAYARIRMRDFDAGKKDLASCREIDLKYTTRSHYMYSIFALAEYGFASEADELFRLALADTDNPNDYLVAISYATFLSTTRHTSQRDTKRAVELMKMAASQKRVQKNEDLSRYELWVYAVVLANDGRTDAAITMLEQVLAIPRTSEHDPSEKFLAEVTMTLAALKDGSYEPTISATY